jgi:hypothetical protein
MSSITKSRFRHFPYKHPTFGTKLHPKPKSAWESSVYYWWWAYLRQNERYLECCESGGKGELAGLFAKFGDVRGNDFRSWWKEPVEGIERGAYLFAEPATNSIRALEEGEKAPPRAEALTLTLPLNLPKKLLEQRFSEFLNTHHKGKRGVQLAKSSNAICKVKGQPNVPALALGLKIYEMRKSTPDMPLWEIGNELPEVLRAQKLKATDLPQDSLMKKKALAATVSRFLKIVQARIDKTIEGESIFP